MKTSLLLLVSAVFVLSGCDQDAAPAAAVPAPAPAGATATAAPAGGSAGPNGGGLAEQWTPQVGDAVAERIVSRLRLRGDLDAPMSAKWDRERKQILVTIGGARSKVEQSKETLEKMHSTIEREVKPEIAREFGYTLPSGEISLIYVNRKSGKEIVRFTNGSYLLP